MKFLAKTTGIIIALGMALPVLADEPAFTYAEVGYVRLNLDGIDADPDGYNLKGSYAFNESTFARGSYADLEDDLDGTDIESQDFTLGLGYKAAVSETSVWYIAADYVEVKVDVDDSSDRGNGYSLGMGTRTFLTTKFELALEFNYADVEEAEGFAGSVGAVYYFTNMIGLTVDASLDDNDNSSAGVGVRFNF